MKILVLIPSSKHARNVPRDLIYGCWCKGRRIGGIRFPPLPQLLVTTILRKSGFNADLIDSSILPEGLLSVENKINEYDFLVMLTSTMTILEDAANLGRLKQINPRLKTLVFGSHPTFMPKQTLSLKSIDFIAMREPEMIIKELAESINNKKPLKNILGLGWKENGSIHINDFHPLVENLDDLPIPDRDLLPQGIDYFNPIVKRIPYTTMMTSRGCPGSCTFCSSPSFYGKKYRLQSADRVFEEIEYLKRKGFKEIFFRDETFTASKKRVHDICEKIISKNIDITWICSTRIDSIDLETMRLMKKAGCHMIRVGVESGVQSLLNNIKKNITTEQTRQVFKWTHQIGLDTHAHCMLGVPGETQNTVSQTINFVKEIDPTIVTFGICTPYPGTALFESIKTKHPEIGDGTDIDLSKLHTQAFFNQYFTELSTNELQKSLRKAYKQFYLRPNYIMKWIPRISNIDEFRRITLAATQVFQFISGKD